MSRLKLFRLPLFNLLGGTSFIAGVILFTCLATFVRLPSLRGPWSVDFLAYFFIAGMAYLWSLYRLDRDRLNPVTMWSFAIGFRLVLLLTSPTLSDDVYRYLWDGHLIRQGINPYALPVNSPELDVFTTPLRQLVNHNWMASPYLPSAQIVFGIVALIAPQNILAIQVTSVLLDLITGWLVIDSLARLDLPTNRGLIYLWNPLVIVVFAHGAHVVDALMVCLVMLTFWLLLMARPHTMKSKIILSVSALSLAVGTLTKGIPILLLPILWRRWQMKRVWLYTGVIIAALWFASLGAGWGLLGPQNGRGVFGALRIYLDSWNYNSGLYHWIEVYLSGYQTPGAVPIEKVGETSIMIARLTTALITLLIATLAGHLAWRADDPQRRDFSKRTLSLIRISVIPISAYLLLTPTVHPWYVTLIVPFLPFLLAKKGEEINHQRFVWPWVYFTIAVSLSYLTYLNPNDFREFYQVRQIEYIPLYILLGWASWPFCKRWLTSIRARGNF